MKEKILIVFFYLKMEISLYSIKKMVHNFLIETSLKKKINFSSLSIQKSLNYLSKEEFAILNKKDYTLISLCKFT